MKYNECCYRALKHGFAVCPDCKQTLLPYEPQQTAIVFANKRTR